MESFLDSYRTRSGRTLSDEARLVASNSCFVPFLYSAELFDGDFKAKSILDLGCGSSSRNERTFSSAMFCPWFCRLLAYLGADAIGIDIGDNSSEPFRNYQRDLAIRGSLDVIPDSSIDIVVAQQFFSSPYMQNTLNYNPMEVKNLLLPQIERVLKEDGCYLLLDY